MSNRTIRRAAERKAAKAAARLQKQAMAAAAFAQPQAQPQVMSAASSSYVENSQTSEAQINANRENAQKSTGPTSEAGKATVSQNRRTHGLLGRFLMLPDENPADYDDLIDSINNEFHPQTDDEYRLALSTAQHYWLSQRALRLQEQALFEGDQKKLALFMRYESRHERSYLKARQELKSAIKERTSSEIGFESQKAKNEALESRARLQNAKAEDMEIDTLCKKCIDLPPIPGNSRIGFEQIAKACAKAIAVLAMEERQNAGDFAHSAAA